MKTVSTAKQTAERGAGAQGMFAASAGLVRRFEVFHGSAARAAALNSTPNLVTRSGLQLVGRASAAEAVQAANVAVSARPLALRVDRPTWLKMLWAATVVVSAGAIFLVAP
jgi:hypothetical protein